MFTQDIGSKTSFLFNIFHHSMFLQEILSWYMLVMLTL